MAARRKWLSDGEQAAWRGLLRMHAELTAHLGRQLAAGSGLSMQDYAVLVSLSESPDGQLRVNELGRELGWEKSRVSHHVARMESAGLVERRRCRSDQRGQFVVLTRAGRSALVQAAPGHVAQVRKSFIDRLDPGQLATLADIAGAVLTGLASDDGSGTAAVAP